MVSTASLKDYPLCPAGTLPSPTLEMMRALSSCSVRLFSWHVFDLHTSSTHYLVIFLCILRQRHQAVYFFSSYPQSLSSRYIWFSTRPAKVPRPGGPTAAVTCVKGSASWQRDHAACARALRTPLHLLTMARPRQSPRHSAQSADLPPRGPGTLTLPA